MSTLTHFLETTWPCRQHIHAVAEENRLFEVVGDEEDGNLGPIVYFEQRLVHDRFGQPVHGAVGLVEQQYLRPVDERAHDLGAAGHARGNLARILATELAEARLGQHLVRLRQGISLRQNALHHGAVGDVLCQRLPWEQRAVLEDHDAVGALCRYRLVRSAQQLVVEKDLSRRDRVEARNSVEERRLSASRRTDDHAELARRDLHGAVVHRHDVDALGIVDFDQVSDGERATSRHTAGTVELE